MTRTRTRRLAAFALVLAPALAVGPAAAVHAAGAGTADAAARAKCAVETESNGKYHLWGVGFHPGTKVTYSASSSGSSSSTVSTDHSGRFDIGGLTGSKWTVKTENGKKTVACVAFHH